MIVGVGIDVVDIGRFEESLERTPAMRERLFTVLERTRPSASLAARFAAKEALAKALGAPGDYRPVLVLTARRWEVHGPDPRWLVPLLALLLQEIAGVGGRFRLRRRVASLLDCTAAHDAPGPA